MKQERKKAWNWCLNCKRKKTEEEEEENKKEGKEESNKNQRRAFAPSGFNSWATVSLLLESYKRWV